MQVPYIREIAIKLTRVAQITTLSTQSSLKRIYRCFSCFINLLTLILIIVPVSFYKTYSILLYSISTSSLSSSPSTLSLLSRISRIGQLILLSREYQKRSFLINFLRRFLEYIPQYLIPSNSSRIYAPLSNTDLTLKGPNQRKSSLVFLDLSQSIRLILYISTISSSLILDFRIL